MRVIGVFGAALAACCLMVACTDQGGAAKSVSQSVAKPAGASSSRGTSSTGSPVAKPARFANLPDRGELTHYDAQAPIQEGAYTWRRAEVSEQHAIDAMASGLLHVTAPSGQVLGFQFDHSIRHDSGDWTWVGHLPGQQAVQAVLTFGKGAVYGSIGQPDARPLKIAMRAGASWMVETDPTQLVGIASHAAHPLASDALIVPPATLQQLRESRSARGAQSAALAPKEVAGTAAVKPTVDLVVGYTQGFVTAQGSAANAITRINHLVDLANTALNTSQVNGQVRLVHTLQVNYTDTNDNGDALGQLTGYDSDTQKEVTPNAAFNGLRAAREQYGADLVSLIRPFREPEQDSCGIAWLIGGGKQQVTSSNGWDFFGYSVVSDGQDKNEDDGKNYYCEEHTLAHELGHNMGLAHDRETAKGSDGVLNDPDDYGAFSYSFGYKPTGVGNNFYTIMAYGDSGQTSYLVYSNPNISVCGGKPCGVANSEDNARTLGQVLPAVAGFRAAVAATRFNDVPASYWAYTQIDRIAELGITGGCSVSPPLYCPTSVVTRDQMAVFLLRSMYGGAYQPPSATGVFADVPANYWAAASIEKVYGLGITGGCSASPLKYCPTSPVLRDQMAVFLLRAKHGSNYQPPAATGMFTDVPTNYWAAAWIEQLAHEGVTGGCTTSPPKYCPQASVTRDQMAVFLVRNFGL